MKIKYEDVAFDLIKKFKQEIDTYTSRLGQQKLKEILFSYFSLSEKDSCKFLELFENMIPGVPFDAIPQEWFFTVNQNSTYKPISESRSRIRKERLIIIDAIKVCWSLPEELKTNVIKLWPDEWRGYLEKKQIDTGDEIVQYSASEIANLILSKRYEATPSTINSYSKGPKFNYRHILPARSGQDLLSEDFS
jgi:hypothetical protein